MSLTLTAKKRTENVKPDALRAESAVPSVLYGFDTENVSLQVNKQEFDKVFAQSGRAQIVDLDVDGTVYHVLVKEVQIDPVRRDATHVDFYSVDVSKAVIVKIPLHFEGVAPAVKASGGSLMKGLNFLEVECLPKDLVKFFTIDLTVLETLEDSISVADLQIGDKFKVLTNETEMVATVVPPKVEAEPEPAETEEGEEAEGDAATPTEGDAAPAAEDKKE
jgi:large subunit ribosomal protein L25